MSSKSRAHSHFMSFRVLQSPFFFWDYVNLTDLKYEDYISDECCRSISSLPLTSLCLFRSSITDDTLSLFSQLRSLDLNNAPVLNGQSLEDLPFLTALRIREHCSIRVGILSVLTNLQSLNVDGHLQITNKTISHLSKLTKLKAMMCGVNEDVRSYLPNLKICEIFK